MVLIYQMHMRKKTNVLVETICLQWFKCGCFLLFQLFGCVSFNCVMYLFHFLKWMFFNVVKTENHNY